MTKCWGLQTTQVQEVRSANVVLTSDPTTRYDPVTVKNIPTHEIIPPVYFRVRKSVKNMLGGMFSHQAICNG